MKRFALTLLLLTATFVLIACAFGATQQQLQKRASFDLDCPKDKLEVVEIDERTRGVRGCGQRATYVEQCKPCANGNQVCDCTWLLNTDGRREAKQ